MAKHGKTYRAVKEKVSADAVSVADAAKFVKENSRKSFDETVELHVHLGINPEKSDQMVRGQVMLPEGAVKEQKIVIFDGKDGDKLIEEIAKSGNLDADVTIATPEMMPKLAKVARVLGPKGLMPNPKTGTVTDKPEAVAGELRGGKLSFRMDQQGNIHQSIAKASWDTAKITNNVEALIKAVNEAKPDTSKGQYIKSISLCTTMGPSVKVAS